MYFADVLNSRGLFQYLGGWVGVSQPHCTSTTSTLISKVGELVEIQQML